MTDGRFRDVLDDIMETEGMPGEQSESAPGAVFENVTALRETDKALLCRIGRKERWVPKGQIHDDSEVYKNGDTGKLAISAWLADKWDEETDDKPKKQREDDEPPVKLNDVVCLRESGKAIQIRQGTDGEEIWIPRSQILEESEVQNEGDLGKLVITAWIAKQKNLS